jgi:hypothetical protein
MDPLSRNHLGWWCNENQNGCTKSSKSSSRNRRNTLYISVILRVYYIYPTSSKINWQPYGNQNNQFC